MHSFQTMPQISEAVSPVETSTVSPWSNMEGLSSNTEAKICESEVTAALPAPCPIVLPHLAIEQLDPLKISPNERWCLGLVSLL